MSRRDTMQDALVASTSMTVFGRALAGYTKLDPNALETGAPTESGGRISIRIGSETVVSGLPSAALTYTWELDDLRGQAASLGHRDLVRFLVGTFGAPAAYTGGAVDLILMAGLVAGGTPTAARRGVAAGLVPNAGNWQVLSNANQTGAGWAAWTAAAATAAGTRHAAHFMGQLATSPTSATCIAYPLDSAGALVAGSVGSGGTRNFSTGTPAFTHFFIGAGWNTGAGGTAGTYEIAARLAAMSLTDLTGMIPT